MASQPDESFRLGGDSFPASTPSGLAAATPSHLQGSLATTRTPPLLLARSRLLLDSFFLASSPSTMFLKFKHQLLQTLGLSVVLHKSRISSRLASNWCKRQCQLLQEVGEDDKVPELVHGETFEVAAEDS